MKKKKITEPLNHIQHQLLWNGKLYKCEYLFCQMQNETRSEKIYYVCL